MFCRFCFVLSIVLVLSVEVESAFCRNTFCRLLCSIYFILLAVFLPFFSPALDMNHDFFLSRWVSPFQLDWKLQYIKNWCDSSANYKWCYHSFGCCLECISLEMQCEWNASDNFEAKNRVAGNGEHKLHCLKNAILMIVSQSKRFSGIIFCVVPFGVPFSCSRCNLGHFEISSINSRMKVFVKIFYSKHFWLVAPDKSN